MKPDVQSLTFARKGVYFPSLHLERTPTLSRGAPWHGDAVVAHVLRPNGRS